MKNEILKKKKYQQRKALRQLKRRRKRKQWRKEKNILLIELRRGRKVRQKREKDLIEYIPPSVFVLRENADEVLEFIFKLKAHKTEWGNVFINLSNIEKITNGSIGLLLSVVNVLTKKKIDVAGDKPKNREARRILERSGFFNFVDGHVEEENKQSIDTIITKGKDTVNQGATAKIVMNAMKTVTGKPMRNPPIQSMLIELMANSVNHAFPNKGAKYQNKWVLAVSHDIAGRKVTFAFIDNGVGILETLKLSLTRHLRMIFKNNKDLLETAFEGRIGSRTGLTYRGRGLPSILKKFNSNQISELVVISNDVFLDFENGNKYLLKNQFSGTFYYWEVSTKSNYYGKDF